MFLPLSTQNRETAEEWKETKGPKPDYKRLGAGEKVDWVAHTGFYWWCSPLFIDVHFALNYRYFVDEGKMW